MSDPGAKVTVRGIECSRGHFNNPLSAYCSVCGISMVHNTHQLVDGERPTLGFLVFDDGATFALDRNYLFGRFPKDIARSSFAPVVITDEKQGVSRGHAEIELVEWEVAVTDLGSTNGTYLFDAARNVWQRIDAYTQVVLEPGTHVAIGSRRFVFEAAHS